MPVGHRQLHWLYRPGTSYDLRHTAAVAVGEAGGVTLYAVLYHEGYLNTILYSSTANARISSENGDIIAVLPGTVSS